ncbi:hypothetical protein HMSSN139_47770 [Paenibacillus sp. HMSSN-139]|nr:hypothetical protein HMSSN139_47770 [Paenibacillus sp. HMSSN-139]
MQVVEVGVHNETLIEIVSGLTEGQEVVIPTVISTSSGSAAQQQQMRMQGGFGGSSGFGGGTVPASAEARLPAGARLLQPAQADSAAEVEDNGHGNSPLDRREAPRSRVSHGR